MFKLIIKGGLGNQMFQYAAVYSLAKKRNIDFIIDLSFIKNRIPIAGFTYRNYELDLFNISTETTAFFDNEFLDRYCSYPLEKMLFHTGIFKTFTDKNIYELDPTFFNIPDNTYIEGYFNNPRYFEAYKKEIKQIFNLNLFFNKKFEDIEKQIKNTNSVSVNIRRGDYLNHKHKNVFVNLTEDYYLKAIQIIRKKIKNPHFYIFSYDDPKWFKKVLQLKDNEFTYMDKRYIGEKFKTYLRLISLCKHNIISNSTFAFWGAYLNRNTDKIVIAPKKWMHTNGEFEIPIDWNSI